MKAFQKLFVLGFLIFLISCGQKENKTELQSESDSILKDTTTVDSNIKLENHNKSNKDYSSNLLDFIPQNYSILDNVAGDLNLDNRLDMIMVLKKDGEELESDVNENQEKRPLLILIMQEDGTYKLAARNDNTVYCYDCGGMMGDPYTGITIKNGFFSVEHYGGSAWRWTKIITYKYSKEDNNWFLFKDGSDSYHTSDPDKVESEIRTVKDFGKVEFKDFDIYK